MRFVDIEVGKIYHNTMSAPNDKRVPVFKTDKYLVVETSNLPYPIVCDNLDSIYQNWVEVRPKNYVYCSVWIGPKNGYEWTLSSKDKLDYTRRKEDYLHSLYVMIKEWELEYEV